MSSYGLYALSVRHGPYTAGIIFAVSATKSTEQQIIYNVNFFYSFVVLFLRNAEHMGELRYNYTQRIDGHLMICANSSQVMEWRPGNNSRVTRY